MFVTFSDFQNNINIVSLIGIIILFINYYMYHRKEIVLGNVDILQIIIK